MARHIVTAVLLLVAATFAVLSLLGILRSKNNLAALHCAGVLNVLTPPVALIAVVADVGLGISAVKMLVLTVVLLAGAPVTAHAIGVAEHRRKPR